MSDALVEEGSPAEFPLVGQVINDRYRILRVLGKGGMGTVYEAEHQLIGRRVALKTLLPEFAKDPDLLERFRREARAASTIGHEHIVDVTDMGSLANGEPYLVMEILAGQELAELMEEVGPMPLGRAVQILLDVCSALEAAHAVDIVHRDLKPANIFLVERPDGSDFPKLLDFGISKMRGDPNDQGLTSTGVAIGTPAYMSPEQAQGLKTVDHRSDVYAIGVILYEMLTTQKPFTAESYASLLIQVMMVPPPSVRELREDVPEEVAEVISKALAKDPSERFADIGELAAALRPFADVQITPRLSLTVPDAPRKVAVGAHTDVLGTGATSAAGDAARTRAPSAAPTAAEVPQARRDNSVHLPALRIPIVPLVIAALVIVGGGVAAYFGLSSDAAEPAPPIAATEPAAQTEEEPAPEPEAAPAPTAPPTAAPPTVAPAAQEVRVQIRVVPADAQIFIGDTQFPSPMDAQQPRSLTPTTIRIERRGYRTIERVVIFDQDRAFDYEMSRGRGVDREQPASAPAVASPRAAPEASDDEPEIYQGDVRSLRREF